MNAVFQASSEAILRGRTRLRESARSPRLRLGVLAAALLAVMTLYLFTDLPNNAAYAWGLRTRTIVAMLIVAVAIGGATVLFQTVTHNRVLTPGIMGFDAAFLAVQVIVAFVIGPALLVSAPPLASWAMELAITGGGVVLLYWWLFARRRHDLHVVVLAGLVLGITLRAVTAFLQRLLDPDTFAIVQNLLFASFTAIDRELLLPTALLVAGAFASLWPVRRHLDVLSLGPSTAVSLGVEPRRVGMHVIIVIAVSVAASTALVGPVTFFGLLVANLAYVLVGHRHAVSVPAAVGIGAVSLIGGQLVLDRLFGFGTELPVVIEFAGGIFFLLLVVTGRSR